jgi:coenzyme PQQ precursor peptide PqqA
MWTQNVNQQRWETPTATEMRFGFEVTMYVNNK